MTGNNEEVGRIYFIFIQSVVRSHRVLSAGQESRPQPKSKRRVSGYPTQEKTIQKEENKKKINIKNPKITKDNKKLKFL